MKPEIGLLGTNPDLTTKTKLDSFTYSKYNLLVILSRRRSWRTEHIFPLKMPANSFEPTVGCCTPVRLSVLAFILGLFTP